MTVAELISFCEKHQTIIGILFSGSGVVFATWIYHKFTRAGAASNPQPSITVSENTESIAQDNTNSSITFGDSFDQRGQKVGVQNIADTIINNYPAEQYTADLVDKEKEIRQLLIDTALSNRDKQDLENELAQVENLRLDEQSSYQAHIKDLKERINRLEQLTRQVQDQLIEDAKKALIAGDKHQAEKLFEQVKEQASSHIMVAAEAEYQLGKLAEDDFHYRSAYHHFQYATQLAPENTDISNAAGLVAQIMGQYEVAIGHYKSALARDFKHFGEDHARIAVYRNNLGLAWASLGRYKQAIEHYELALASHLNTFGEEHSSVATVRNNLGLTWLSMGEYNKTIEYCELALASDLRTFGEGHFSVARDRNNLGLAWKSLGKPEKSIEYFNQALASNLKTFGEHHPRVAADNNNLGSTLEYMGEYNRAINHYETALTIGVETLGNTHPSIATYHNNIGGAWLSLGKHKKAIKHYKLALVNGLKTLGKEHPSVAIYHDNLGRAWQSLGEYKKAIKYHKLAYTAFKNSLGINHLSTKNSRRSLTLAKDRLLAEKQKEIG